MTLFTFDVDGTLLTKEMDGKGQYVKGIIPTAKLIKLHNEGNFIGIVSPSPFLPVQFSGTPHWFKKNGSNEYRWENVFAAQKFYGVTHESTIYVDDLEANRNQLESHGIKSYSPEAFMEMF